MATYLDVDNDLLIKHSEIVVFLEYEYAEIVEACDAYCDSTGEFIGVADFLMMLVRGYTDAV